MNNNETRQMTTFFIWLALIVTILTAITSEAASHSRGFFLISCAIFTIGAIGATITIWKNGAPDENRQTIQRRSQVERWLEGMDESDLDELRTRLIVERDYQRRS